MYHIHVSKNYFAHVKAFHSKKKNETGLPAAGLHLLCYWTSQMGNTWCSFALGLNKSEKIRSGLDLLLLYGKHT